MSSRDESLSVPKLASRVPAEAFRPYMPEPETEIHEPVCRWCYEPWPCARADRPQDLNAANDAINAVLRKQPSLAYAGFVYGDTGAAVVREYAALAPATPEADRE